LVNDPGNASFEYQTEEEHESHESHESQKYVGWTEQIRKVQQLQDFFQHKENVGQRQLF
jgi:hypothetical protein